MEIFTEAARQMGKISEEKVVAEIRAQRKKNVGRGGEGTNRG
jgi:hypothetical protein